MASGFIVIAFIAYIFQSSSDVPAWKDGSPIEYFTASILWVSAVICVCIARHCVESKWKVFFWIPGSVALVLLGVDELVALHEKTSDLLGDDEYIKVVQLIIVGAAIIILWFAHGIGILALKAFILGLAFHSLYLLCDFGDGEFFRMPFIEKDDTKTLEEYMELAALSSYCYALMMIYFDVKKKENNNC